jgi:uncharacterized membrane protein YhiD involved in acid resistance
MLLKLGIIATILIAGGIIFSSEIQEILPNTSTSGVDSLKTDVNTLTTKSFESAEQKIDSSVEQAGTKLSDFGHQTVQTAENTINSSVEQVETKLSEIKQDSSEYIEENITDKFSFLNSTKESD